jgi:hypothetical protein
MKQLKFIDMIEKIQKVYDDIKHKYSNGENNTKVRLLLKTELLFEKIVK